jgi:hypothetical protein
MSANGIGSNTTRVRRDVPYTVRDALTNQDPREIGLALRAINLAGILDAIAAALAVKASLSLGTLAAGHLDTVVRARAAGVGGNAVTVAATGDSAPAGGVTISESGSAVTIHFEDGVSTVADVEAAIAAHSTKIEVATAGTGATVLADATDDFTATHLAGGATPLDVSALDQPLYPQATR